jgi:4-hydroxybenzoate polyprenyltransferase
MYTMNDIIDVERDKIKFPMRPLPSGLIPRWVAAIYATIMAGIGVMVAYLTFNWLCASIALTVIVLGCIYTRYTRDKIGYLTLVWIPAFEPVGAWAAVSPETIQTPLPWLLYTFLAINQVAMMIAEEVADHQLKPSSSDPNQIMRWHSTPIHHRHVSSRCNNILLCKATPAVYADANRNHNLGSQPNI